MYNKILKLIFLFAVIFFLSANGWTQSIDSTTVDTLKKSIKFTKGKNDTTIEKKKTENKMTSQKKKELKGFIDKNANGIDDRLEGKGGKNKKKGKDLFIDNNGDGISDGQESAFGLKKTSRKRRQSKGKNR